MDDSPPELSPEGHLLQRTRTRRKTLPSAKHDNALFPRSAKFIEGDFNMTVERALRLMAGTVILLPFALGHWLSPYWYRFTAFVGLNRFQSGLTNWCAVMFLRRRLALQDSITFLSNG
jgi:hypothetical protein